MLKKTKQAIRQHTITVTFGYILFAAMLLSVIVSTVIPLGSALFHPTAQYFNIVLMLGVFVVAAVLPALGSYLLGDRATHSKNKALHHYNGVLFGVAAYWLSLLTSFFASDLFLGVQDIDYRLRMVLTNGIPIALTIGVMAYVTYGYAKFRKSKYSVALHRPYQIVLITAFLAVPAISFIGPLFLPGGDIVLTLVIVATPLFMAAISYACLAHTQPTRLARLVGAIFAVSIAFIISTVSGQLLNYGLGPVLLGIIAWLLYLLLMLRSSRI